MIYIGILHHNHLKMVKTKLDTPAPSLLLLSNQHNNDTYITRAINHQYRLPLPPFC